MRTEAGTGHNYSDSSVAGSLASPQSFTAAVDDEFNAIQAGLGSAFISKGVGALSSFLTAELGACPDSAADGFFG